LLDIGEDRVIFGANDKFPSINRIPQRLEMRLRLR